MSVRQLVKQSIENAFLRCIKQGREPELSELGEKDIVYTRTQNKFTSISILMPNGAFYQGISKMSPGDKYNLSIGITIATYRAVRNSCK